MITRSLKINTKTIIELDEQTYRELLSDTDWMKYGKGWGNYILFGKDKRVYFDNKKNLSRRVYSYWPIGDDGVKGFKFADELSKCPHELLELKVDFKHKGTKIKATTQSGLA